MDPCLCMAESICCPQEKHLHLTKVKNISTDSSRMGALLRGTLSMFPKYFHSFSVTYLRNFGDMPFSSRSGQSRGYSLSLRKQ